MAKNREKGGFNMLVELTEQQFELINQADKDTFMKTDMYWLEEKNFIGVQELFVIIEDLICELHNERQKNEQLENDMKENFVSIKKYEQYE